MLLMTLANKITSGRFLLTIAYFVLVDLMARKLRAGERDVPLMSAAFVLNQIVAWSDMLDGYVARRMKQVTHFGRIADPLVDKVLVCGSFIYFLTIPGLDDIFKAWFVVVILGREFLVSGIRSAAEAAGIPFPASFWGKAKTFIQCVAVGWGVGHMAWTHQVVWTRVALEILMWGALVSTVLSGLTYVLEARRLFRSERV
jgi:CDP-diacylglycerol--glycerol-3-phosphate 3-phosphatidyltransferase